MRRFASLLGLLACVAEGSMAAEAVEALSPGCPGAAANQKQVFFGDLHVHTAFSMDAYAVGTRVDPGDAYAFAKGQELTLADGRTRVQLDRPLDFAAVTDHAENFDVMFICADPSFADLEYCARFRRASRPTPGIEGFRKFFAPLVTGDQARTAPVCDQRSGECGEARRSQWRRVQAFANEANEPCRFTAFIGNEWSATPNNRHWHRNLIFAGERATEYPVNYVDQPTVESMWDALDKQCRVEHGCDVIAIPHNLNLAEGGGFDVETASDMRLRQRMRYELLAEIYQHKGSSECMPAFGMDDAGDCSFEMMLHPRFGRRWRQTLDENQWNQLRSSFFRSVLARGLAVQAVRGLNPLQLGVVASTDTHNGAAGFVDEAEWPGSFGADVSASVRFSLFPDASPGGLVAIWAEENSRASLFAGLRRREVYGTSGPRIVLRFFATRSAQAEACSAAGQEDIITPMGGELPALGRDKPVFVVQALMDRNPLERIEIVRGVVGKTGVEESVLRLPTRRGAGAALCAAFRDAQYSDSAPAYWYARVLQVPTPRWSSYDCAKQKDCDSASERDVMIRERAWSSPIWRLP